MYSWGGTLSCVSEQHALGPSNFICSYDPDCITYVEHGSKNYCARAKDLRFENKEVPCPAIPEERPKCLVFLMDLYLAKLPPFAFENNILYLRPKCTTPQAPESTWYDNIPVGKNTLQTMVKDMCVEAEIYGKTNHSLRATGTTTLFQNDVPERVIQKVTGHRSLEALCTYEKVSTKQHRNVSKLMMTNSTNIEVEAGHTSSYDKLSTGFLGGVNGCSIGTFTVNFTGSFSSKKDCVDSE